MGKERKGWRSLKRKGERGTGVIVSVEVVGSPQVEVPMGEDKSLMQQKKTTKTQISDQLLEGL